MDKRDIVEQLQDACDLAMNPLKLERLCGNAKIEIERLRSAIAAIQQRSADNTDDRETVYAVHHMALTALTPNAK